jgi:hypothetical protein
VVTLTKPKLIGTVSCDSGRISVLDPCHLEVSDSGSVSLPAWNLHTSFKTELGDGEFCVYAQRDRQGRLRRIVIELE